MSPLEVVRLAALVAHFVGLAAVIGPWIMQLKVREGFRLQAMVIGVAVQIGTGIVLIASRKLQGLEVIDEKMIVKLVIAVLAAAAIVTGALLQRRARAAGVSDRAARPAMLAAGGLAIADVAVAVLLS